MSENKKEKTVFVTGDQAVHKKGKIDPADAEILKSVKTGEGLIKITSKEQLEHIAKGLVAAFDGCVEFCKRNMTKKQAEIIRELRVDKGYTWRAVAHACHDLQWWSPDEYWDRVPSTQPMGMALCEVAAEFFNENYQEPPWN